MNAPRFEWIRKGGLLAIAVAALAAWLLWRAPEKESDSLNVPLGVEQAAIVTWSGPPLAVAPYKSGVAVNVRIASVTERPGARIYDVRYLVNRGGTFDLKEYLAAADGTPLDGLPSFKFHGDPKLSKDLDARIQETEAVRVEIRGHYYATLIALAILWLVWLLLLILYKRPKRVSEAAPAPPEPTLAERVRAALARLESGPLDAGEKARLEMLILRRWREALALETLPMHASLERIDRDHQAGLALRQLQHWIHHRASPIQRQELAALLAPFAAPPRPAAPGDQP